MLLPTLQNNQGLQSNEGPSTASIDPAMPMPMPVPLSPPPLIDPPDDRIMPPFVDPIGTFELWKTDGTNTGTTLIKTLKGQNFFPGSLTSVNNKLYFIAYDDTNGSELWQSDGTDAGTKLLKDIHPGINSSNIYNFTNLVDNNLYFTADDGKTGIELWKTDGTEAGTILIKDINPGTVDTFPNGSFPDNLTKINNTIYFTAYDEKNGSELWKTDGTEAGTQLVKDIYPGESKSDFIEPVPLPAIDPPESKPETETMPALFAPPRSSFPNSGYPNSLTNINGTLYFSAEDGINGSELWKSDGTEAGTVLVKDIAPGNIDNSLIDKSFPQGSYPNSFTDVNGTLYFVADDGINGMELWKSDGTASGTMLVKDLKPGITKFASPILLSEDVKPSPQFLKAILKAK